MTQRNVNAFSSTRPSSAARWSRKWPSTRDPTSQASATNSSVSPGFAAKASSSACERNFAIGERSSPDSSRASHASPFAPRSFAMLLERRELCTRERARHAEETDGLCPGEDAELRAPGRLRRVLELEAEARVGLVRAEAPVGFGERHPRKRRLDLDAEALAPDRREHLLLEGEELLAVGKRHLDVELRDLLDAVGAKVLVAEADRDLVVAVEAGHHRQLLEDLRALRQREEAPLVQPAGHDEVARSLGGGLEEDRRLDVEVAGGFHVAADDRDHLCP